MPLTISLENMQKVEFKADPDKCNISFRNYAPGRTLLVTDIPAAAGTMLGAVNSFTYFVNPGAPSTTPPVVFIDYVDTTVIPNGAGPSVDLVKYGGRIELREFT
jgi:hypothetical protein